MENIAKQLMELLDASPVNFLAAAYVEEQLKAAGFTHLDAGKPFPMLVPGKGYFVAKNNSALCSQRFALFPCETSGGDVY